MDGISAALCAGAMAANFACIEPAFLLVETVAGPKPAVHVVFEMDSPRDCFRLALDMQPRNGGFLSCIPTDEQSEESLAAFMAQTYGFSE